MIMKCYYPIYLIIIVSFLMACEKDDICAETNPSTPQLVISIGVVSGCTHLI